MWQASYPYFSDEMIDTAWIITETELAPLACSMLLRNEALMFRVTRQVRGHRMAKAALENAMWDLEAQQKRISLAELLGGPARLLPVVCRLRFNPSGEAAGKIEAELSAGYQRIKLKCKPGWDRHIFEAVRKRWPGILLSCDANSAYRMKDFDHIASWDEFSLLMIEQPLWYDDFYFHSMLQKRIETPICLDESIRNRRDALAAIDMESCQIINIKVGRVGGFSEAIAVHNAAEERGIPVGAEACSRQVSVERTTLLSSLSNFSLPGDVSASARYWAKDIIEPKVTVSKQGEIVVPKGVASGYAGLA